MVPISKKGRKKEEKKWKEKKEPEGEEGKGEKSEFGGDLETFAFLRVETDTPGTANQSGRKRSTLFWRRRRTLFGVRKSPVGGRRKGSYMSCGRVTRRRVVYRSTNPPTPSPVKVSILPGNAA